MPNPAALPTAHITASVDQVVLFAAGLCIGIPRFAPSIACSVTLVRVTSVPVSRVHLDDFS